MNLLFTHVSIEGHKLWAKSSKIHDIPAELLLV